MKVKRIGIIGPSNDADAQGLKARIEDRGGAATIIDLDQVPSSMKASIGPESVAFDGMELLDFDAFYARRVAALWYLPPLDWTKEEWAGSYERFNDRMADQRAILSFKISLARILCDRKLVINPHEAWGYHQLKLHMFWVLKENGFRVPRFTGGNDYFDLRRFLEARAAVDKPLVSGPVHRVDASSLEGARESLRKRPVLYQEFIEGTSIRAFVLGDKVIVACELPQKEEGVDASERIESMKRIDLPKQLEKEIVRAAKTLHMVFSGVDLQYEESSGDYYFLECNSSPYFTPYDAQVGAGVGGMLADYLLERS